MAIDMTKMCDYFYQLGNDGKQRRAHQTWYRGEHCNFIASKANLQEPDAIDKYILHGWTPAAPFITRETCVTAFGSCFAQHISQFLQQRGYTTGASMVEKGIIADFHDSHVIEFGEGIVNTFAILQQFEFAYDNKSFAENLWYGSDGQLADYNERVRKATSKLFDRTEVFILTLGLSEVWYNKITGEVFWRAIPREQFDPDIHGFKVSTCQENIDNLEKLYALIRKHKPDAPLIFTLSPIPLVATFRPVSCVTASTVSKAILRAALDELVRNHEQDKHLHYWPSYEIVKEYFTDPYVDDNRHVKPEVLDTVMSKFEQYYLTDRDVNGSQAQAQAGQQLFFARFQKKQLQVARKLFTWCGLKDLRRYKPGAASHA
jgi:hypothetical protein